MRRCFCAPGIAAPHRVASILLISACLFAACASAATSEWIRPGADGKLVYKTTPAGDRIMDFSFAGYMGGGVALPKIPVLQTIRPSGGDDDSDQIQTAIDAVSAMPMKDGFRGAVRLAPGLIRARRPSRWPPAALCFGAAVAEPTRAKSAQSN
jgi:hypothetical protein